MAGYRVDLAISGLEALQKCRFRPPDLLLLDADLPAVNGFCTQLRQEPATRHIPLILTGLFGAWWSQHPITVDGSVDFLPIPISYETLLERIEQWLRQEPV